MNTVPRTVAAPAVAKTSRTADAIARIKQMILDGELHPGDRLPREADLADRLGLSRSSLREAVRALTLVRVLDVRQGDGTYVTSLNPSMLLESFAFVVDLHRSDNVLHFFHVRRLLEPEATALAAAAMTDEEVTGLHEHLSALGQQPSVDDLVVNDIEFHRRIAYGSGNPVLAALLDSLTGPTQRARLWRGFAQRDAVGRTLAEHLAIADAISHRQPEMARAAALLHVAGLELFLREHAGDAPLGNVQVDDSP
jgi:GntR family transcriptional regulator, transcriptional repressor for pyruvate dehydrogenase complex